MDTYFPNFNLNSPNITSEEFDSAINDGSFIPYAGVNLRYDYSHFYADGLNEDEKNIIDIALNNMQSIIC